MWDSTARASCLVCYSRSDEQQLPCPATASPMLGTCSSDLLALLLRVQTIATNTTRCFLTFHTVIISVLLGHSLQGEIRSGQAIPLACNTANCECETCTVHQNLLAHNGSHSNTRSVAVICSDSQVSCSAAAAAATACSSRSDLVLDR